MANTTRYAAGDVVISWNGVDKLTEGWGSDTFLEVEVNSARNEFTPSQTPGHGCFSKLSDRSATIRVTYQQTADANKDIAKIAFIQDQVGAALQASPFTVLDRTGNSANFVAMEAVLTELPGQSYGATVGEKTWTWVTPIYIEGSDPETILANIDAYIG